MATVPSLIASQSTVSDLLENVNSFSDSKIKSNYFSSLSTNLERKKVQTFNLNGLSLDVIADVMIRPNSGDKSDKSLDFFSRFRQDSGDKDINIPDWTINNNKSTGYRFYTTKTQVDGGITALYDAQRFVYGKRDNSSDNLLDNCLVINSSVQTPEVTSGTTFRVEILLIFTILKDCNIELNVYAGSKKMSAGFTFIKPIADPRIISGTRTSYQLFPTTFKSCLTKKQLDAFSMDGISSDKPEEKASPINENNMEFSNESQQNKNLYNKYYLKLLVFSILLIIFTVSILDYFSMIKNYFYPDIKYPDQKWYETTDALRKYLKPVSELDPVYLTDELTATILSVKNIKRNFTVIMDHLTDLSNEERLEMNQYENYFNEKSYRNITLDNVNIYPESLMFKAMRYKLAYLTHHLYRIETYLYINMFISFLLCIVIAKFILKR